MHGQYDPNAGQDPANPLFTVREAEIVGLVAKQLGVEAAIVTRKSKFADDLGADSLDMVELTMVLEEHFGIDISDDEAEKVTTVNDAFETIRSKLPA